MGRAKTTQIPIIIYLEPTEHRPDSQSLAETSPVPRTPSPGIKSRNELARLALSVSESNMQSSPRTLPTPHDDITLLRKFVEFAHRKLNLQSNLVEWDSYMSMPWTSKLNLFRKQISQLKWLSRSWDFHIGDYK